MAVTRDPQVPFRALIVGGGVAALEGALALRHLAPERIAVTLLAPDEEFVYRPMSVREPFGYALARRYPLERITRDNDIELIQDSFQSLDSVTRIVETQTAQQISYDALLLALGARRTNRYPRALTLDDRRLDEQLHGLIQDVEQDLIHKLAFVVPSRMPWPLPVYELALMTATRAYDMNVQISITIITPEEAPLAVFGVAASDRVRRLLEQRRIVTITSSRCEVPAANRVSIRPGARELQMDRVIAAPELAGPVVPGIPTTASGGFVPIDAYSRVAGLERVFAAGDATDFPIKHGGIAAQQADTAAASIAALSGEIVKRMPLRPILHAVLLGAERPLYLSADVTGGAGHTSLISETAPWAPPTKIVARHLAPYLDTLDSASTIARSAVASR